MSYARLQLILAF